MKTMSVDRSFSQNLRALNNESRKLRLQRPQTK
jgi:hypothetical protein